jgi:uncharacterized protein (DUF2147 family)
MMNMRSRILSVACLGLLATAGPLSAAELKDMIGTWKWTDYTVETKECTTNPAGLCATVVTGPKNTGMEMIRSKLESKGGEFFGQIAHPATGDIYDTKLTLKNADTWSMAGCVVANKSVCATGDFVRVK